MRFEKKSIFAQRLRIARKAMGLRQEDLSERLGVSRQTIVAVENGRYNPTLKLAMRLAHFLNTTVESLFLMEEVE